MEQKENGTEKESETEKESLSFREENATEFADRISTSDTGCNPFSREDVKVLTVITKNYSAVEEIVNKLMEANFSEFKIGIILEYIVTRRKLRKFRIMEEKVKEQREEIEEYIKIVEESLDLIAKQNGLLEKCDYIFEKLAEMKEKKEITPETMQMAVVMKGLIELSKKEKVNKEREEKRKKAGFKSRI